MEAVVLRTIEKYKMLQPGDTVIVAVSGGADSMALLHFLHRHKETLGVTLGAAHLEHGMRGETSLQDAAYVQRMCDERNIPLYMRHAHMSATPRPTGIGVEEWGRHLRYDFFEELALEHNAKIATAHTLSDNAETVLFRAIRGAGPRGMAGIPPVRDVFVRPLLEVSRQQVETYCEEQSLNYIFDCTNADLQYSRNLLRLQVMPLLEQAHPGAVGALGRLAADMRQVDALLSEQAAALLTETKRGQGYDAVTLLAAPQPILLHALAALVGPSATRAMLENLLQVLRGEVAGLQLPKGQRAYLRSGCFFLAEDAKNQAEVVPYEIVLTEGKMDLPGGYSLNVRLVVRESMPECGKLKKNSKNCFTFTADYDKIKECESVPVFRTRHGGDIFAPAGRNVTKTLKKWMNEEKIPSECRKTWPFLCCGSRVLWAWNAGFAREVAVENSTKKILVIEQL